MAPVVDDVDEMAEGLKAGRWEMEQGGGGLGEIKRERQRMEKRGGGGLPPLEFKVFANVSLGHGVISRALLCRCQSNPVVTGKCHGVN